MIYLYSMGAFLRNLVISNQPLPRTAGERCGSTRMLLARRHCACRSRSVAYRRTRPDRPAYDTP